MICQKCERFFDWLQGAKSPATRFYHHRLWKSWQEAVAKGCVFCTFVRSQFESEIESLLSGDNDEEQELLPTLRWELNGSEFPNLVLDVEDPVDTVAFSKELLLVPVSQGKGMILHRPKCA